MNTVQFLHRAFKPPALGNPPQRCNEICAMSGMSITKGYPLKDILSTATANIADTIKGNSGWVSVEAAELFKANRIMRGNLLALDDCGVKPVVAKRGGRLRWRDLIFSLESGQPSVAVFTDNFQRRLWPFARLSNIGDHWQVLAHFGHNSRIVSVNIHRLRDCLNLVEEVYGLGFSKQAIGTTLFVSQNNKLVNLMNAHDVMVHERSLKDWRLTDEFAIALFVAQKEE